MSARSPMNATLTVSGLFAVGLLAGAITGSAAAARAQEPYAELSLFARVLTTIETDYVDEISTRELVDAAIRGMVEELDRHSRWMSREQYASLNEETAGRYEGIGVQLRQQQDPPALVIERVLPGSPAARDGLLPGDVIVAVDAQPVVSLSMEEIAQLLEGPRGAAVVLTVDREAWERPQPVRTIRDTVEVPAVQAGMLSPGVGYARVLQFQSGASSELDQTIAALRDRYDLRSLVLDLRDNPGGLLDEAVAVSDLFLDEGPIVSTRGRIEGERSHQATPGGYAELPLVTLINGGSASASEIVAGALQDTGRSLLVGTPTFGKGTVQTVYRNRDDSALKLTIATYYTPSGEPVADRDGREPDLHVELPGQPNAAHRLQERIERLEGLSPNEREDLLALVADLDLAQPQHPEVPWQLPLEERLQVDSQLAAAAELAASR